MGPCLVSAQAWACLFILSRASSCLRCVHAEMWGCVLTLHVRTHVQASQHHMGPHTHTQLDNTRKNGKRRTCNTTLLDDMVVPCALMCMHAARVSIVDQAMALRCSRGAVVGVCVVDSPHMCMLCSCTWNNMQYTNSPYNTACGQIEAL